MDIKDLKTDPILISHSEELQGDVRAALKGLGISKVLTPANVSDALEMLDMNPDAMLILDWEVGAEEVNRVLITTKKDMSLSTREILLVANSDDQHSVVAGIEYGVSRICMGGASKENLEFELRLLTKEHLSLSQSKQAMQEVVTLRQKGDWSAATTQLQRMHISSEDDELVAFELVENLIHEGSWVDAITVIHPFAESEEPNPRALHLMARCLMSKGEFDNAISMLNQAQLGNPHNVERLIDLGQSYLAVNNYDDAAETFGEALRIDGESKDAHTGLTQSKLMSGELNEALPLLKNITNPREMAAIFNSSAILVGRSGNYQHSLKLYKLGVTILEKKPLIAARLIFNMGIAYKKLEAFQNSFYCFEKAFELDNSFKRAQQHKAYMGQIMRLGDQAVSLGATELVAEDEGDNPFDLKDLPSEQKTAELAGDMEFSPALTDDDDVIDF